NWAAPERVHTYSGAGGFYADDIVVVRFTTGSGPSNPSNFPRIAGAEDSAGTLMRRAILSGTPCTFHRRPPRRPQTWPRRAHGAPGSYEESVSITIPFAVDSDNFGYYTLLHTNTTYYLNVITLACPPTVSCDMQFDLSKNSAP